MASFKQNKSGNWSFVIDAGYDKISGRRKQKTISEDDAGKPFKEEHQARSYADKIKEEIMRGRKFDSVKITNYITEFFERIVVEKVSEVTYEHQWMVTRLYIIPYIGKYSVDKINDDHIENYYARLGKDGVSRAYLAQIKLILNKMFKHALKKRIIVENPMNLVTTPTYEPKVKNVLTPEQVDHFLECNRGSKFYTLYVVAESTGMRRGELLSLKWVDVDLEQCKITINKSLKQTKKSGKHVKGPKTENSRRTINIPKYTVEALIAHKKTLLPDAELVFDNFGTFFSPKLVSDNFLRDCKRSSLPHNTLHGLRHAHATHLLKMGFSVADVAARLGDTKETIMRTYAHVLPNAQSEIAAALDNRKSVDKSDADTEK